MVRNFHIVIAAILVATTFCQAQMALKKSQSENIPVINKEFLIYKGSKADAQSQESREKHMDSNVSGLNTESKIGHSGPQTVAAELGLCIVASMIKSVTGSAERIDCDFSHHRAH